MKTSKFDYTISLSSLETEWSSTFHFGGDELAAEKFGLAALSIVPPLRIVGGYTDSTGRGFFPDFHWCFTEHNEEIAVQAFAKKLWRERNPTGDPASLYWGELTEIQRWTFTDEVREVYAAQFSEQGE